jgi:hypothetical protein
MEVKYLQKQRHLPPFTFYIVVISAVGGRSCWLKHVVYVLSQSSYVVVLNGKI